MMILVSYDVSTTDKAGQKRLTKVAKQCVNYGQRVQNSVFECMLDSSQFLLFKNALLKLIDPKKDSLRFYILGNKWENRVEHYGVQPAVMQTDVLLV